MKTGDLPDPGVLAVLRWPRVHRPLTLAAGALRAGWRAQPAAPLCTYSPTQALEEVLLPGHWPRHQCPHPEKYCAAMCSYRLPLFSANLLRKQSFEFNEDNTAWWMSPLSFKKHHCRAEQNYPALWLRCDHCQFLLGGKPHPAHGWPPFSHDRFCWLHVLSSIRLHVELTGSLGGLCYLSLRYGVERTLGVPDHIRIKPNDLGQMSSVLIRKGNLGTVTEEGLCAGTGRR